MVGFPEGFLREGSRVDRFDSTALNTPCESVPILPQEFDHRGAPYPPPEDSLRVVCREFESTGSTERWHFQLAQYTAYDQVMDDRYAMRSFLRLRSPRGNLTHWSPSFEVPLRAPRAYLLTNSDPSFLVLLFANKGGLGDDYFWAQLVRLLPPDSLEVGREYHAGGQPCD